MLYNAKPFCKKFIFNNGINITIKRLHHVSLSTQKFKYLPINNRVCSHFPYETDVHIPMLPLLYAALNFISGSSDNRYDDYKGSYNFTYALLVNKNELISKYIYYIQHYRSYIDFRLYQVVPKEDPREDRLYHEPQDQFFSNSDLTYFSHFFTHFAIGYMEGAKHTPLPFVKTSDSNHLIFGFYENEYFIYTIEDYDEFHEAKDEWLNKIPINCYFDYEKFDSELKDEIVIADATAFAPLPRIFT